MQFDLKITDFETREDEIEVTSVWVDPEFQKQQEMLGNVIKKNEGLSTIRTCLAKVLMNDYMIEVEYNPETIDETTSFFEKVNKTLEYTSNNIDKIYQEISEELLSIKNTSWLSDGEREYDKSTFIECIGNLKSIEFQSDSDSVLWFSDNGLFLNHDIEVRMNNNEIREVSVSG